MGIRYHLTKRDKKDFGAVEIIVGTFHFGYYGVYDPDNGQQQLRLNKL